MHGYRDHSIRPSFHNAEFYCPCSMCFKCPFCSNYRQKVEEYPINQQQPPISTPPSYTPKISDTAQPGLAAVEFGAITPCIFRMTYIWLKNGNSFWSYPVFINRATASGWRYENGSWIYFNVDLRDIKNFICT